MARTFRAGEFSLAATAAGRVPYPSDAAARRKASSATADAGVLGRIRDESLLWLEEGEGELCENIQFPCDPHAELDSNRAYSAYPLWLWPRAG